MTKDEIIEQYSWLIPSGSRVDFLGAIDALIIHERQKAFEEAAKIIEDMPRKERSSKDKLIKAILAKGGGGER